MDSVPIAGLRIGEALALTDARPKRYDVLAEIGQAPAPPLPGMHHGAVVPARATKRQRATRMPGAKNGRRNRRRALLATRPTRRS